MTPENITQKIVLRRIRTIWFLRRLVTPIALKCYIALGLLWQIFSRVSVFDVFKNSPDFTNMAASWDFLMWAFAHTEFAVQAVVFMGILYLGWVGRDAISNAILFSSFGRSVRSRELA